MSRYMDEKRDWRRELERCHLEVHVAGTNVTRSRRGDFWEPEWDPTEAEDRDRFEPSNERHGHRSFHRHGFFPWPIFFLFFAFGGGPMIFGVLALTLLAVFAYVLFTVLAPQLGAGSAVPSLGERWAPVFPGHRRDGGARTITQSAPVASLGGRFASGEIDRATFRRQLVDVLKDRYVRGELTLAEYEEHLDRVLKDPLS